jgi:hypothetical protein
MVEVLGMKLERRKFKYLAYTYNLEAGILLPHECYFEYVLPTDAAWLEVAFERTKEQLAEAEERIAELEKENETLRIQLAACGVVAISNTRLSREQRLKKGDPFWSASYGNVCSTVDREIAHRERVETLEKALMEIEKDWCVAGVNELVNDKSCAHCIAKKALEAKG